MQMSVIREAKDGNYVMITVAFLLSSSLSIYYSVFLSFCPSAFSNFLFSFYSAFFVSPYLFYMLQFDA
jgi:hypothetical protein